MTNDEFTNSLDRWGSDLDLWPEAERANGVKALRASAEARQAHARAQHIDALLGAEHRAPRVLHDQILARVANQDFGQRLADWFAGTFWKPGLAAACLLALGFAFGFAGSTEPVSEAELEAISVLAFFDTYQEIDNAL